MVWWHGTRFRLVGRARRRYNPHDAIYAAAYYLCDNGAGRGDLHSAIFAYNHADWYVNEVLAQAAKYCETTSNASVACPTFQSTLQSSGEHFSSRALVAVRFACAQLGKPYVWGGNGDPGFDCSGLTRAAYAAAGITLPRVAQDQFNAGPAVSGQPPLPGDLVFFGASTSTITHVGIAVSPTDMINAPDVGLPVRLDKISSHLVGVTRPADRAQR
jgi:cell wall-associated NlpC family hydrolase